MATFPPVRPVTISPPNVQSPRPVTLPGAPNKMPAAAHVVDSSRAVQVQSFVVTIPAIIS